MKTRDEQWQNIIAIGPDGAAGIAHFLYGYLRSAEEHKNIIPPGKLFDEMAEQVEQELKRQNEWQNKREAVCVS